MNKLLYIFSLTTLSSLLSCSPAVDQGENINEEQIQASNEPSDSIKGIPFFDFNSVAHYAIEIDEEEIWALRTKDSTENNYLLFELLSNNYPDDIADTSFIEKLEDLGFTKYEIDTSLNGTLNELFSEKEHDKLYEYMCIPEYRDIFVFRNFSKITGIAKICFTCDQAHILGAKANTKYFGMSGDYGRLWDLVYKERLKRIE